MVKKRHVVSYVLLAMVGILLLGSVQVGYQYQYDLMAPFVTHQLLMAGAGMEVALQVSHQMARLSAILWLLGILVPLLLITASSILLLFNHDQPRVFRIAKYAFWLVPVEGWICTAWWMQKTPRWFPPDLSWGVTLVGTGAVWLGITAAFWIVAWLPNLIRKRRQRARQVPEQATAALRQETSPAAEPEAGPPPENLAASGE